MFFEDTQQQEMCHKTSELKHWTKGDKSHPWSAPAQTVVDIKVLLWVVVNQPLVTKCNTVLQPHQHKVF